MMTDAEKLELLGEFLSSQGLWGDFKSYLNGLKIDDVESIFVAYGIEQL